MSGEEQAKKHALIGLFASTGGVTEPTLAALQPLLTPRSFEAGTFLLRGGEHAEWCFLLERGLVREYYLAVDGQEHIRSFVAEQQVTGSLLDLISGQPAVTWIQALEVTRAWAFRYVEFDTLCQHAPDLQRCALRFAQQMYVRKAKREHDMLALSARERWMAWLSEQPGLDARIRRQHLASYLGVTPEHLSRLRSRS